MSVSAADTTYFQVGDYHDTLMIEDDGDTGEDEMVGRYLTNDFHGHQMVHCHILPHEDEASHDAKSEERKAKSSQLKEKKGSYFMAYLELVKPMSEENLQSGL